MTTPALFEISILLPTRGRTDALLRSISSLIDTADTPARVELLLAFDNDDTESFGWFQQHIAPVIDAAGAAYSCFGYEPMGYIRLNEYVNSLAQQARGNWLVFWNDDAVMQTAGWDTVIAEHTDFAVLRMPAHQDHPYAIFPIVPKRWLHICGYLSAHQLSDAWISQIAYMLDIMVTVPITVLHDRYDLTGNNQDQTYQKRPMLEGKGKHPADFHHVSHRRARVQDAIKIAQVLRAEGHDVSWFDAVLAGNQDPWAKMTDAEHDPNQQLARLK